MSGFQLCVCNETNVYATLLLCKSSMMPYRREVSQVMSTMLQPSMYRALYGRTKKGNRT